MTLSPDQQRLADAWLAECWRPVREYHAPDDDRADAAVRNEVLAERYGDDGMQLRVA